MTTTLKRVADLKAGDLAHDHGAVFRVLEDARESNTHRPRYWDRAECIHVTLAGPSNCAYARAVCVQGEVPGYFKPGSEWTFQGAAAVRVHVENLEPTA